MSKLIQYNWKLIKKSDVCLCVFNWRLKSENGKFSQWIESCGRIKVTENCWVRVKINEKWRTCMIYIYLYILLIV